jgi:predicted GH43/DUF377 family glycosyl hydrolase
MPFAMPELERVAGPDAERAVVEPGHLCGLVETRRKELFARYAGNPILSAADWPYPINVPFNPAATLLADGTTLLLCRVEGRTGASHLTVARSRNGFEGWEIDPAPSLEPDPTQPEEMWGIEDARITHVPDLDQYAVVYTSYGPIGPGVSLAFTRDFRSYERLGQILHPENKDAALFPRKIDGQWAMVHRPVIAGGKQAHIWISYSPDLVYWGRHKMVIPARSGSWWDSARIGLSCPPLETEEGWLMIYHGVKLTVAGAIYRVGLALLDRDDPQRLLARSNSWVMTAETSYETIGDIGNVVFPCGFTLDPDNPDTLRLYYGGADSCIAVATGSVREMLDFLKSDG